GLPPCTANGVRAHAEPHSELEDPREQARRRQPDDKSLQDTQPGICLHDTDQAENGISGHEAVGVKCDGKLVTAAPPGAKFTHVAGLVSGIDCPSPVADSDAIAPTLG